MKEQRWVVQRHHELDDGGDTEEWTAGNEWMPEEQGTLYETEDEAQEVCDLIKSGEDVTVKEVYR